MKRQQRSESDPQPLATVGGAYDPHFCSAVRAFARLFPAFGLGGGAMAVYLDGVPVVDVWTGFADRQQTVRWSANTAPMVFSATKGMASTVVHRLADRGLLDYDLPVAHYWPAFAANGKAALTIRDVMGHRSGLSHLPGLTKDDVLDTRVMEQRIAAARPGAFLGKSAYHALTYGWILSGLTRAITGLGMRDLVRSELAHPLNTDGLHLGRPPAEAPTRAAQIVTLQGIRRNRITGRITPKLAARPRSGLLGAIYFPGVLSTLQGQTPMLDSEIPSANAVATARGLARMYGAIANGGQIDGTQFLRPATVTALAEPRHREMDRNVYTPLGFQLGYHAVPSARLGPGFGHAGLGGSVGWADPASGLAFGFVHNRLHLSMVVDHAAFAVLYALVRRGAARIREVGVTPVPDFGAPFSAPAASAS